MNKKVIIECKPDEKLMRVLGLSRIEIAHQANKGEVCKYLLKSEISLAIIDEDPMSSQPKLLADFKVVEDKYEVKKLHLKVGGKIILILKPRLEEWILDRCKASGVQPESHHLPSNNKRLKDVINSKLELWERLLQDLLNRRDEGLLFLKEQIKNSITRNE